MAKRGQLIVGLDIGTTKVCAIVGEVKEEGVDIVGIGCHPSRGLREGVVINVEGTVYAIKKAVEDAEMMAGCRITSAYTAIAGTHIKSFNSHGVIGIREKEVSERDVSRVIEAAKAMAIPPDREVFHILPQEFVVDDQMGIKEPVGMNGVRLEAKVHIVTGAAAAAQNIVKCTNRTGLEVKEIVLGQLASAQAVSSREERELGVAVLDIGGGTTDIALFSKGSVRYTACLPVGGNHITSDISIGLRVPGQEAERVKRKFGCAMVSMVERGESLEVSGVGDRAPRVVSRQLLAEIIEARAQEILEMARDEIVDSGYQDMLTGGVVLTGGASVLKGFPDLAEVVFCVPARLGVPAGIGGLVDSIMSPIYSTGVGLVLLGHQNGNRYPKGLEERPALQRAGIRIGRWLAGFF